MIDRAKRTIERHGVCLLSARHTLPTAMILAGVKQTRAGDLPSSEAGSRPDGVMLEFVPSASWHRITSALVQQPSELTRSKP
jgi:hypothetical protein